MRSNFFIIISVFTIIFSCSFNKEKNELMDSDSVDIKYTVLLDNKDYDSLNPIDDNNNLFDSSQCMLDSNSFGCNILISHKFPRLFESYPEQDKSHIESFNNMTFCYNYLNSKKNFSYLYSIYPFEAVSNPNFGYLNQIDIPNKIDSVKYQLQNMGPYMCYYAFDYRDNKEYGYLLLFDQKQKKTKVLKIYLKTYDELASSSLYFYINSNKEILLSFFYFGEVEVEYNNIATISITDSGELKIIP